MLELWLVRHGQTDFSRENRFCGSIDPPLSDIGQRMAEALGESHGKNKWDAIYCSPSLRARQTATPLAKRAGRELVIDEGLREISYGDWEGMKHEEAKAKFPDVYAYWAQDTASRAPSLAACSRPCSVSGNSRCPLNESTADDAVCACRAR